AHLLRVPRPWERAPTQLNVVADMDDAAGPMREMVGHALRCEKIRAAVFEGRRSPMVFGEPEAWLAPPSRGRAPERGRGPPRLPQSPLRSGAGETEPARSLAASAYQAAPATRGSIDGMPLEW